MTRDFRSTRRVHTCRIARPKSAGLDPVSISRAALNAAARLFMTRVRAVMSRIRVGSGVSRRSLKPASIACAFLVHVSPRYPLEPG
jgi:hypothetical protein